MTKGVSRRSPFHDITRSCHRWPGTDPTPRTNQAGEYKARSDWQTCPPKYLMKQNWATSKAEYANTQQDLPDWGYTLALYLDMKGFWLEGLFCRKAVKSRSLIAGYSFQVIVQLTILGEHLSNSIYGENNYLLSSNQPNSSSSSSSSTSYSMWQKG